MATKWPIEKIPRNSEALSSKFPDYEIIEHVLLTCTDVVNNNNKFYSLEIHKSSNGSYRTYSHYGRNIKSSDQGAFELRGPGSLEEMKKVFDDIVKDKTTRKKEQYQKVEVVKGSVGSPKARLIVRKVEADASIVKKAKSTAPEIKIDPLVAQLIDQIFADSSATLKSMVDVSITADGFETPIGVLSPKQLENGRAVLMDFKNFFAGKKTSKEELGKLNSRYFTLIPHQFGYKITENDWIKNDVDLQRESDLLQLMGDSLEIGSAAFSDSAASKLSQLGINIEVVDKNSNEFSKAENSIHTTISNHHRDLQKIKVKNLFRIELPGERKRYEATSIGNEQALFHGSRNCNVVGILKHGLLIAPPEAPVSGYAFDKGLYFADMSSKSLNYSLKSFGRAPSRDSCFLFLTKVKCGKMLELDDGDYQAATSCKQKGCDSVKGVVGRRLLHNEYITYTLQQNTLTHLVELTRPVSYYY